MNILFLTGLMVRGFGVAVVVDELAARLQSLGMKVFIGCMEKDSSFPRSDISFLPDDVPAIKKFVLGNEIDCVIAHSSPYFELLPELRSDVICWAWEHGEPPPHFFPDRLFKDGETKRKNRAGHKHGQVYPAIAGVIAISEFIRHDIQWPDATIIHNGCDHVPDYGMKPRQAFIDSHRLRVGTLMRLGAGETEYKGNKLFISLAESFKKSKDSISFAVMGRGTEEDARAFTDAGIAVHLNATDAERSAFLRNLDVFVSCSLWEGFNLPLIEAQASGTAGLALDTGSHPEVTPLLCKDLSDMRRRIEAYSRNRSLAHAHSQLAYAYVRNRFSWDMTALRLVQLLNQRHGRSMPKRNFLRRHPRIQKEISAYAKKKFYVLTGRLISAGLVPEWMQRKKRRRLRDSDANPV